MIQLKSRRCTLERVSRTRAKGWENVKDGHQIIISLDIEDVSGASGGGLYATTFKIVNIDTGEIWYNHTSRLISGLKHFKIK